jgi:hypothetical protein
MHGIYLWPSEADAIRCESKWRESEGQHFDRNCLVEVGFSYSNLTRVDTQWIDNFLLNNDVSLDRNDLTWAHRYWRGDQWDESPHWELIAEGRGVIWGTTLRMKALKRVETSWPNLLGQLELARIAAELGSDLYTMAPFVFAKEDGVWRVDFLIDARDENADFMAKAGSFIRSTDRSAINWNALERLRSERQARPDLTGEGFEFDSSLLTPEGRAGISTLVSHRDSVTWGGFTHINVELPSNLVS